MTKAINNIASQLRRVGALERVYVCCVVMLVRIGFRVSAVIVVPSVLFRPIYARLRI